jgi:MOSC domain-containing protein YiiM
VLEREVTPGLFGENLRTRGIDVTGAVVGERWRVGEQVLLEVTFPRTPCGTFERRMRLPG